VTFRALRAQEGFMKDEQAQARSALADDHAKFNEIYTRYAKLVHAYCARRTTFPQVADAVSETFLVAWRRLDQIGDVDSALPWLYGTAYRVLSHQWRRRSRGQQLMKRLVDSDPSEERTPEVIVMQRQENDLVLLAAQRLPKADQEILRLTLWEELSHAEVGRALSIPLSAVKQRAYRARRNLTREYSQLTRERRSPATQEGGAR
jgi:RNA polymerase sigma-70 factor, ECF subfamily